MTHYWWMHWFWITAYLHICNCNSDTTEEYPLTQKIPVVNQHLTNESFRISKAIGGPIYNPPISVTPSKVLINSTTQIITTRKLTKIPLKKIEFILSNTTTKLNNNTTIYPPLKETTVIDQNITDYSLNNTDNQTLVNTSFNAINHNENLTTLVYSDNNLNHTEILNSERVSSDDDKNVSGSLSAAGITGITFGCVAVVGVICTLSYVLYRNRGFNRPQVLNDRCSNPDSSGYIDDASVRDNSEEMYSLDNDSFLNSLEAMTIQNYWTDTVKHTKL